jgi:2-polyprenyl-3-methyl-5-hydroxy-6-metoxy-1,4-benzoquinol methylase
VACIVCGAPEGTPSRLRRDLVECPRCGLLYCPNPREDRAEFTERYYQDGAYADYQSEESSIRRSANHRLKALERVTSGRRLLDVGCAAGYFLESARTRGWQPIGLELSAHAARRALVRQIEVYEGSIMSPPRLPMFDAVTMWDTIEHIARPDIALQNARGLLNPGGVLAISTGDRRSLAARALGARWRLFADETHKYFFDQATLGALLEQAGLRPIAWSRGGKWVGLVMILHQLPAPGARHLRDILMRRNWNPSIYVSLRDVMTVLAKAE